MAIEKIQIGLERVANDPPQVMLGARLGLLMNQASVDHRLRYACDVINEAFPGKLTTLFSPQHGLWGEQQANMIESSHAVHPRMGVPAHSLYSETRSPTVEMLKEVDCFVVDLQDVGTRVYTFIWSISHCLEVCAALDIPVVILDRPNPIGGELTEGPMLEPGMQSFVGRTQIPLRHGLTLGELTCVVNDLMQINADVHVVPMSGWQRWMTWHETNRRWIWPSPNMPRPETASVYPGTVLLEGTNLSEGRGTTMPFEVVGAPFVDPDRLADYMQQYALPGLSLLPLRFVPTFDKWRGESCGGVLLQITDQAAFRPILTSTVLLTAIRSLWPNEFRWLAPPYEYESEKQPIDIIAGTSRLREQIDTVEPRQAPSLVQLKQVLDFDEKQWRDRCSRFLLYP